MSPKLFLSQLRALVEYNHELEHVNAVQLSNALDHSSQKQRAARQFRDNNVFVEGVRSVAKPSHAIERRNANASSEVSVRAAAHRRFFEFPVNLPRDRLRFFVE